MRLQKNFRYIAQELTRRLSKQVRDKLLRRLTPSHNFWRRGIYDKSFLERYFKNDFDS